MLFCIKKLIRERDYLYDLVNKDTLTGLNNRRILKDIKNYSAVVMCDIADYKQVNDLYGHSIGDSVIKSVSYMLKSFIKESDYICRYGGDEFLIVFVDSNENIVKERIKSMRELVESNLILTNGEKITISLGFVMNEGSDSLTELIDKADIALYESKEKGKNQITKYKGLKK